MGPFHTLQGYFGLWNFKGGSWIYDPRLDYEGLGWARGRVDREGPGGLGRDLLELRSTSPMLQSSPGWGMCEGQDPGAPGCQGGYLFFFFLI